MNRNNNCSNNKKGSATRVNLNQTIFQTKEKEAIHKPKAKIAQHTKKTEGQFESDAIYRAGDSGQPQTQRENSTTPKKTEGQFLSDVISRAGDSGKPQTRSEKRNKLFVHT
jgi:hypothetical protein